MPIASSDLQFYDCASNAQDDVSTEGGAIDLTKQVIFDSAALANSLADKLDYASTNAGDTTQTLSILYRTSAGSILTETINLNGTTTVAGTATMDRILKATVSGAHTGSITLKKHTGATTVLTIPTGVLQVRRFDYDLAANAAGGATKVAYQKFFIKNTHGSLALSHGQVSFTADGGGLTDFALANAANDSTSIANRLTTPASITAFSTAAKNIPADLQPGDYIGVWVRTTLAAGTAPGTFTFTTTPSGTST